MNGTDPQFAFRETSGNSSSNLQNSHRLRGASRMEAKTSDAMLTRRYGPHPGRRVERHLENRSFLFGECAKSLDVVYVDAFTSCGQHAALLPLGEQTAHGKQSRAGHLRQLLARKVDPERAVPG